MTREEKSRVIEDLTAQLAGTNVVYIADISGLNAGVYTVTATGAATCLATSYKPQPVQVMDGGRRDYRRARRRRGDAAC